MNRIQVMSTFSKHAAPMVTVMEVLPDGALRKLDAEWPFPPNDDERPDWFHGGHYVQVEEWEQVGKDKHGNPIFKRVQP